MSKATLTRFPGVHRRSDSGIYQFGLRAPADLLEHFPSGWAVRQSLGTAELRIANEKAKALQADWAQRFEAMRTGRPADVDLASMRAKLYARFETLLEHVDEQYSGLVGDVRHERAEQLLWQLEDARAGARKGSVPDWAESWVNELGFPRGPLADAEAMAHLVMVLEIRHEALSDESRTFPIRVSKLEARKNLLAIMAPALVKPATEGARSAPMVGRYRIADALEAWKETKRLEKTVGTFTRHAQQFADMMSDPHLESIDKAAAIEFRDKLQRWAIENHKTALTADNVLVSIRALVNVARDKGWIPGNPFERLAVKVGGRESEGREPWTHSELTVLFDDPIWTEGKLPDDRKAGGAAGGKSEGKPLKRAFRGLCGPRVQNQPSNHHACSG